MLKFITLASVPVLLAACATTPDVTYTYYLPTSQTTLTLTEAISCTKDKTALIVTSTPDVATVYMADMDGGQTLKVRDLDGSFADSDPAPSFSEDGRLKGFTLTQTGQGSAIVKSLVTLVADASKLGGSVGVAPKHAPPKPKLTDQCNYIDQHGSSGSLTLIVARKLNLADSLPPPSNLAFFTDPAIDRGLLVDNPEAYAMLRDHLPKILAHIDSSPEIQVADASCTANDSQLPLHLRKTKNVTVDFLVGTVRKGATSVVVPGNSATSAYCIALPKAAPFGTNKFSLTLTDSGAITGLEYNKTNGTQDALSSADTALTTIAPLLSSSAKTTAGASPQPASITTVSQ
ncbi:MAG: hypothetical protein ACREHE_13330 [Rhizomicrobium sp.]